MSPARGNCAIVLTPPGAGAIGVVRVIGPDALSIVGKLFRAKTGQSRAAPYSARAEACAALVSGDRLRCGRFVVDEEVVDDVVISQTQTDDLAAVDICAHGGVRVIERVLEALERCGAPLLENAKSPMPIWPTTNLIDREAAEAMSRATTERAVRFLAWQRRHLPSFLEQAASLCQVEVNETRRMLQAALAGYDAARTLIDGATVVILGPPNSGKSTLFNRLIGRSATIVSRRPGTTRDWVAESIEIDGVPLTLLDTAGQREATEFLERQAIERGWALSRQAAVSLLLLDGSQPLSEAARALCTACRPLSCCLTVVNKVDLGQVWDRSTLPPERADGGIEPIRVSALVGVGLDMLAQGILRVLGFEGRVDTVPSLFTARQREITAEALSDLPDHREAAEATIMDRLIGA